MEKITVNDAKEALDLAKSKAKNYDEIMEMVCNSAKYGSTFCMFCELMSPDAEQKLKQKGFMIGYVKDVFNVQHTRISWLEA